MAEQNQLRALCKKGKMKELLARLQSTGSQEKLKQGFEPDLSQPIHYAALHGDSEMVRELVETYGCDPLCQNVHDITPLHCASYCGRLNVVQYLLKWGNVEGYRGGMSPCLFALLHDRRRDSASTS